MVIDRREGLVPDWLCSDEDLDAVGAAGMVETVAEDPTAVLLELAGHPNATEAGVPDLAQLLRFVDTSDWGGDRCRTCEAPVVFVRSAATGRAMILDGRPDKRVILRNDLGEMAEQGDPAASASVVDVWTDHHVTCPQSKAWTGRTRANPPSLLDEDGGRRGD
jgi:hypothetical protein